MSDDINIKIKIQATKAELALKRLATASGVLDERTKQAAIRTQILTDRQKRLAAAANGTSKKLNVMNIALASFIGNLTSRAVSAGVTTLINGLKGLVNAGKEFEAGLVNIGKTTGLSGRALDSLGRSIQDIGKRIPVSTESLLEIATVAGQLGLKGSANITTFTETMAKLQLATDIAGTEGSQNVAKILTITGELGENGTENIRKFGAVITKLGNDFAATESQILSVAKEVAKGTAAFGASSEDILGLATAFKATGSEAETAGSAIQRTFILMGSAVKDGGDKLIKFADAAGVTTDEFKKLFTADPTGAFLKLAEGIRNSSSSGADLNDKLKGLGLGSIRVTKALVPLISNYDTLSRAINSARQEAVDKNALDEETARAQDTLNADLVKLSNSYDRFGTILFEVVGPAMRSVVQSMTSFLDVMGEILNRKVLIAITGGLVTMTVALIAFNHAAIAAAFKAIPALIVAGWNLFAVITAITGGLNLVIPALLAVGAGAALLIDSFGDAAREAEAFNLQLEDQAAAYETLDEDSQIYLDVLNLTTQGLIRGSNGVELYTKKIAGLNTNLVEIKDSQASWATEVGDSNKEIVLFVSDKTKELKKFFKEEEIAALMSNFAIIKSVKERQAFESFVASEGKRRRSELFKATIGLDRATLDAARKRQADLKSLRSGMDQFDEMMAQKRTARLLVQKDAELELAMAQEANRIFTQSQEQIFTDEKLIALEDFFTRQEEAEIQAAINSAKNEEDKQLIILKAQTRGNKARLAVSQKLKDDEEKIDKLKSRALQNSTANLFGALASLARNGGKKNLEIYKALATSQAIISTYAAITKTLAEPLLPYPSNVIQAVAIGVQGVANVASIQSQSFERGGVVGGTSFTGDRVTANVNSGEMILNRQQQSQLFKQANGQGSGGQAQEIISNITVTLDGEVVAEAVSRQVANGLVLGEVQ